MTRLAWILASLAIVAFASPAQVAGAQFAAGCPSEAEVKEALARYINEDYWKPSEREIWKIKSVGGFAFGPMRVGQITKKQVEYGRLAQDVCPIRIQYSFATEGQDGTRKETKMGEGKTHLFYKDPFGDWIFKAE